ncbi:MAG: hypothetical protein WBL80_04450 [Erysipelotrichaceae bacterium]
MKKLGKHFIVYLGLSIFTWLFNFIYQLFAHGVKSSYHANLWLVMLAGALFYLLLNQIPDIRRRRFYRIFVNTLNTSVAFLIVGMILKGIINIAGSASDYVIWYFYIAIFGFGLSVVLFILMLLLPYRKIGKVKKELVA